MAGRVTGACALVHLCSQGKNNEPSFVYESEQSLSTHPSSKAVCLPEVYSQNPSLGEEPGLGPPLPELVSVCWFPFLVSLCTLSEGSLLRCHSAEVWEERRSLADHFLGQGRQWAGYQP